MIYFFTPKNFSSYEVNKRNGKWLKNNSNRAEINGVYLKPLILKDKYLKAAGLGDRETIPSGINLGTIPCVYTNLMGFIWFYWLWGLGQGGATPEYQKRNRRKHHGIFIMIALRKSEVQMTSKTSCSVFLHRVHT